MVAVFTSAGLTLAPAAQAESEADRATARELAAEGNSALSRKNYELAEDRFRRADALIHAPTLVVDHARSLVGLGRLAEAYERYQLVRQEGVPAGAPPTWLQALKDAELEAPSLAAKVAWLTFVVKPRGTVRVWMNGREVPPGKLGSKHPVDPGTHAVTARGTGFLPKQLSLTLTSGTETTLAIELEPTPAPAEPLPVRPAQEVAVFAAPPDKDRTWVYVAYGVSAAGLVTGVTTGVLALGVRGDLVDQCPELRCTAKTSEQRRDLQDLKSKYETLGLVSGAGFAVVAAGSVIGTALLLLQNGKASAPGASPRVRPQLGLGQLGVSGRF